VPCGHWEGTGRGGTPTTAAPDAFRSDVCCDMRSGSATVRDASRLGGLLETRSWAAMVAALRAATGYGGAAGAAVRTTAMVLLIGVPTPLESALHAHHRSWPCLVQDSWTKRL
jgi:hypothetical protein